jgi:hypothetical protein
VSRYTSSPQPTSTPSGNVLLEDVPPISPAVAYVIMNTPDDAECVERIKANGLQCLALIHGDLTWENWIGVGAALMIFTGEALVTVGVLKWDANNKRAIKEFNRLWETYEASGGRNDYKPLSSTERWALREIMSNPDISAWRSSLTGPEKRKLNHPNAVINKWKAQQKATAIPAEDRKPSPQAQLKAANVELQEQLHRLKRHGDGSLFTKDSKPKDIIIAIIGTFDGSPNRLTTLKAVTRGLNAWIKQQEMSAN